MNDLEQIKELLRQVLSEQKEAMAEMVEIRIDIASLKKEG